MFGLPSILTYILIVVMAIASVAASLRRIGRGGTHALGGIASLVAIGAMQVMLIYVVLQFHYVSNAIGPGSPNPAFPMNYTPIPWSTVTGFGTPASGPGTLGGP
jgi:hypothetical protein